MSPAVIAHWLLLYSSMLSRDGEVATCHQHFPHLLSVLRSKARPSKASIHIGVIAHEGSQQRPYPEFAQEAGGDPRLRHLRSPRSYQLVTQGTKTVSWRT
ncbi:hypothetical protein BDV12DRAFT_174090 [Aspergillus spectabilis]